MRIQIVGDIDRNASPQLNLALRGLVLNLDPHFLESGLSDESYIVQRNEVAAALEKIDPVSALHLKWYLDEIDDTDYLMYLPRRACRLMRTLKIRSISDPCPNDPNSKIPEEIRLAWIGTELEPSGDMLQPCKLELYHVGTVVQGEDTVIPLPDFLDKNGQPQKLTIPGPITCDKAESQVVYTVSSHEALLVLSKHNKSAFDWWIENAIAYWISDGLHLAFPVSACEVIETNEEDDEQTT